MRASSSASALISEASDRLLVETGSANPCRVTLRRLLPLLNLLALVVSPFGRVAAAEAMTVAHAPAAMTGHCADTPEPEQDRHPDKSSIDCLVACVAMAAAETIVLAVAIPAPQLRHVSVPPGFSGLNPEAEPPPPRLS